MSSSITRAALAKTQAVSPALISINVIPSIDLGVARVLSQGELHNAGEPAPGHTANGVGAPFQQIGPDVSGM